MLEVFKMVLKVEGMAKSFQNKHIFKLYLLFELGKNFTKFFGLSRWELRVFSQTDFGIMINKPYMTHYPKISLGTWSVQLQSDYFMTRTISTPIFIKFLFPIVNRFYKVYKSIEHDLCFMLKSCFLMQSDNKPIQILHKTKCC